MLHLKNSLISKEETHFYWGEFDPKSKRWKVVGSNPIAGQVIMIIESD